MSNKIETAIAVRNSYFRGLFANSGLNGRIGGLMGAGAAARRDTLTLTVSGQQGNGRTNHLVDSLMNQKENIKKMKERVLQNHLDAGGEIDDIRSVLDLYEKQMKSIEQQIAEAQAKDARDRIDALGDKQKPRSKGDAGEGKDQLGIDNERMLHLHRAMEKLDHAEALLHLKKDVEFEIANTEYQMNKDSERVIIKPPYTYMSYGSVDKKAEKIAGLEAFALELEGKIGEATVQALQEAEEGEKNLEKLVAKAARKQKGENEPIEDTEPEETGRRINLTTADGPAQKKK